MPIDTAYFEIIQNADYTLYAHIIDENERTLHVTNDYPTRYDAITAAREWAESTDIANWRTL